MNKIKAHLLEEMCWPDVEEALKETQIVLIPVGAIEQHGPHLPFVTDALIPEVVCKKVSEKIGCVVAPTVKVGYSPHHMPFKGTITLRTVTFMYILKDYAHCLAKHGFKRIIFVNGHGGNQAVLGQVVNELIQELPKVQTLWTGCNGVPEEWSPPFGQGGHSGYIETALILALRPDLVRLDRAVKEFPHYPAGMTKNMSMVAHNSDMLYWRETGVMGDPTKYSRERMIEMGEKMIELSVEHIIRVLEVFKDAYAFRKKDVLPSLKTSK